jgi:hypothetical protein
MATTTYVTIALAKNSILDVPYDMICVVGTGIFSPVQIGKVRVFSINKSNGIFTLLQSFTESGLVDDNFGRAVAINGTGTTFVASSGNPAQVYIYNYNFTLSQYSCTQIIGPIAGVNDDYPGNKLALDNIGNMLAICCNVASPSGNAQAGYVRVYNKVDNTYNLFQTLNGTMAGQYYGADCAFSKDGTTLVVNSNGSLPDSFMYKKFNDSSYIEISSFSNSNITFGRSIAVTGDGARVLVGNDMPASNSGYVFVLDIATFQLKCNSVCWSPELGIAAAVANSGADRVMTSSLKGRPPTSYNIFDNSFNSINESGTWTIRDLNVNTINGQAYIGLTANSVNSSHIQDGSILGNDISNNAITTTKIADGNVTYDKLNSNVTSLINSNIVRNFIGQTGTVTSVLIPIDLVNNEFVDVDVSVRFETSFSGNNRLWAQFYNGSYYGWMFYRISGQANAATNPWVYYGDPYKGMTMWDMTNEVYWRAANLTMRIYKSLETASDPRLYNVEGNSIWAIAGIGKTQGTIHGSIEYRPTHLYLWVPPGCSFVAKSYVTNYK